MTAIRHLVFDLGQVLLRWDPELPYKRLIPDAAERRRFLTEICSPEWNLEQDRGRSWREAEDMLIARHPAEAELIRAFRKHWTEMVPGEIADSVAVFERLAASGIDLTALTNWAPDTFAETEARFPLLKRFRGITVSGHVGLVKPEAAIFQHHARQFALEPEATLFFDDNPANVDGARRAGWNAEVFSGAERMAAQLGEYGVRLA